MARDVLVPLVQESIPVVTALAPLFDGIILPMTLAPTWLQRASDANPLKTIIDGERAMFRGDPG